MAKPISAHLQADFPGAENETQLVIVVDCINYIYDIRFTLQQKTRQGVDTKNIRRNQEMALTHQIELHLF